MLFETQDDTMYNESLIEDLPTPIEHPSIVTPPQDAGMRRAMLGITRTKDGFRMGAPDASPVTTSHDGEVWSGDDVHIGDNPWVLVSSGDYHNLGLLGLQL